MEPLSKGGTASGPVSFMRGADSWAGTIKSGGKTRRAAKMVVLDVDHPDIREFIWCKAKEEDKAAALRDAGFDMSIDGDGFHSIQYQNANNSVRVTDEFMHAVEDDADEHTSELQSRQYLVCRLLLEKKQPRAMPQRLMLLRVLGSRDHADVCRTSTSQTR